MIGVNVLDKKMPAESNQTRQDSKAEQRKRIARRFCIVAASLTLLLLIITATISFYVGSRVIHNSYQEAYATFNVKKVPTKRISLINDNKRNLSVFRVDDAVGSNCFVTSLKTRDMGTDNNAVRSVDATEVQFDTSNIQVKLNRLGDQSQRMCKGATVTWLIHTHK